MFLRALLFVVLFSHRWQSNTAVQMHCRYECEDDQIDTSDQPYECIVKNSSRDDPNTFFLKNINYGNAKIEICYNENLRTAQIDYSGNITAPKPNTFTTSWNVFADSEEKRRLAVNVTWSTSVGDWELDLRPGNISHTVRGFIVFVIKPQAMEEKFDVEVVVPRSRRSEKLNEEVQFDFLMCSDYIIPDDEYHWTIMRKPLYKLDSDVQEVTSDVYIPDCCDNIVATTDYCQRYTWQCNDCSYEEDEDCDDGSGAQDDQGAVPRQDLGRHVAEDWKSDGGFYTGSAPSSSTIAICGLVVGILAIVSLSTLVVYYFWPGCCPASFTNVKGDVLMLINSLGEDPTFHLRANHLASLLAQFGGLGVSFNLQQRTSSDVEPGKWTSDQMNKFSHVVFVCTPAGKKKLEDNTDTAAVDPFVVGMKIAERGMFNPRIRQLKHITCVYFEPDHKACVPKCFKSKFKFVNVQKFCLDKDFYRFFKYVTNKTPPQQMCAKFTEHHNGKNEIEAIVQMPAE